MAEWKLDECGYCGTPTFCILRANGKPQCRACEVVAYYERVLFPPLNYLLLKWQSGYIRRLYGTHESDSARRQYWRSYLSMAKKQGKTFLVAGLPLYHLDVEADRDSIFQPLAVSAASSRDQASLIFKAAASMVNSSASLSQRFKIIDSKHQIVKRNGNGIYEVLSADGATNDGCEPSLAIKDEYHRWKHKRAETLEQVLRKGMVGRDEPLDIKITTSGAKYESPLWAAEHQKAKNVIAGRLTDDRYLPMIWQADPERINKEPGYWMSKEARLAANPSHEDHGGFIEDEKLVAEMQAAVGNPYEQTQYIRLTLNVEVGTDGYKAIDPVMWAACKPTRSLTKRKCYGGLDLAGTTDFASFALLFEEGGDVDYKAWCWIPEDKVDEIQRRVKVNLQTWIKDGWLRTCPGNLIDQNMILDHVVWCAENFNLRQIGYDPWNAGKFEGDATKLGFKMIEVPQTIKTISEPTKTFLSWIVGGQLRHDGSPLDEWCADCLRLKSDGNDNYRPVKPNRNEADSRIDPMVAGINAAHCLIRDRPKKSAYDDVANCVM